MSASPLELVGRSTVVGIGTVSASNEEVFSIE
jgi:hypothetical protein